MKFLPPPTKSSVIESFKIHVTLIMICLLGLFPAQAQQLFCGNTPLTACTGNIGIGAINNGINGSPYALKP